MAIGHSMTKRHVNMSQIKNTCNLTLMLHQPLSNHTQALSKQLAEFSSVSRRSSSFASNLYLQMCCNINRISICLDLHFQLWNSEKDLAVKIWDFSRWQMFNLHNIGLSHPWLTSQSNNSQHQLWILWLWGWGLMIKPHQHCLITAPPFLQFSPAILVLWRWDCGEGFYLPPKSKLPILSYFQLQCDSQPGLGKFSHVLCPPLPLESLYSLAQPT